MWPNIIWLFILIIHRGPDIQTDYDDEGEENDRGSPPHPPRGSSSKLKKTPQQIAGESVLTRVVHEIDATSFTFQEALNFANVIQKTAKKQTTRFAGHLEIGSKFKVSCKIFTKVCIIKYCTYMCSLYNDNIIIYIVSQWYCIDISPNFNLMFSIPTLLR